MEGSEGSRSVLALLPELPALPQSVAGIQDSTHVTLRLHVPSVEVVDDAAGTLAVSAGGDVGLADGAQDGPDGQVTIEGEETLEVHVQILSDGLGVAVPTADAVNEL